MVWVKVERILTVLWLMELNRSNRTRELSLKLEWFDISIVTVDQDWRSWFEVFGYVLAFALSN